MDSDPEVEVIDVRDGAEYSFDELDETEVIAGDTGDSQVIAGKGKLVNHMDTDRMEFDAVLENAESADGVDHADANEAERHELLTVHVANGNGETMARDTEDERNGGNIHPSQKGACARSIAELNKPVCCWVKLWMIIVLIFVTIFFVIILTLLVCSAIHVDEDDQYDRSLFRVSHYFNGTFQISPSNSSSDSHISAHLQQKVANLYRSSHALGRYFSGAEIYGLRNDSAEFEYKLTFVLPKENQEELRIFTLSREMVQNVFRQFLAEQDDVEQGGMYINPLSLQMSSVYMTDADKQT